MTEEDATKPITPQERVLLTSYALTGNMQKSMQKAGYPAFGAHKRGNQILKKKHVQRAYQEIMSRPLDELQANLLRIVRENAAVAFSDIGDVFDEEGNVLPVHEMPEHARRAVSSMKVTRRYYRNRDGDSDMEVTREVKLWSKPQALELFFKYHEKIQQVVDEELGLGSKEKKEFSMEKLLAESMKQGLIHADNKKKGGNGRKIIPERAEGSGQAPGGSDS